MSELDGLEKAMVAIDQLCQKHVAYATRSLYPPPGLEQSLQHDIEQQRAAVRQLLDQLSRGATPSDRP